MDNTSKAQPGGIPLPEAHPSKETINKPAEHLTKEYIEVIEDDDTEEKDQPVEPPAVPGERP